MTQLIRCQVSKNIKDHIKEVMNMALKTKRAQMGVPKTLLNMYMLELRLMGIKVTVENENELHLDWTEAGVKKEMGSRGSSEQRLRDTIRLQESSGKSNKQN